VPTLSATDVLDQVEQIKVVPHLMGTEEMSRLWMAFQTSYRPSAVYQVSVVLLQNRRPASAPLPVLSIGPVDQTTKRPAGVTVNSDMSAPTPTLTTAVPPNGQPAVRVGETLAVTGFHLADGPAVLRFTHTQTGIVNDLPVPAGSATATQLSIALGAAANPWRAGFYTVKALIGSGTAMRVTNALPIALAPTVGTVTKTGSGAATVLTVTFTPSVWQAQRVSCLIGTQEFSPDNFPPPVSNPPSPDPVSQLNFTLDPSALGGAVPWLRLRVDDAESLLILYSAKPPAFDPAQKAPL
jgi:Pvc16 N-terminal domain